MKAWADNHKYKMPSGIALSVWITTHYCENEQDDVALYDTLFRLKRRLFWNNLECVIPAPPEDDLLDRLTDTQKKRFKKELKILINDLYEAIEENDLEYSSEALKFQFGKRFPIIKIH
jgi:hypothetical protein